MDQEDIDMTNIAYDTMDIISDYLPVRDLIPRNASKDMVESLYTKRMRLTPNDIKHYWFSIFMSLIVKVTVICGEYIAGITIYASPLMNVVSQWKYTDDTKPTGKYLDYDIIERLAPNAEYISEDLVNIFKYLYDNGYWTYGGFKDYKSDGIVRYNEPSKFRVDIINSNQVVELSIDGTIHSEKDIREDIVKKMRSIGLKVPRKTLYPGRRLNQTQNRFRVR